MRRIFLCSLLLSSLLLSATEITLEQSIERALENNLELSAEQNALRAARWNTKLSLTGFLPKVSFNSNAVRIDNETYEDATQVMQIPVYDYSNQPIGYVPFSSAALGSGFYKTTYNNNITVQQSIFNGGKVILGYQMSRLAEKQSSLSLREKELDLTFSVVSTYFNILKLNDLLELTEKSVRSSESHLRKVEEKYRNGTAKRSDVLQWKVKKQNDMTQLRELKNNFLELSNLWQNLLGSNEKLLPQEIDVENYDGEIDHYILPEVVLKTKKEEYLQKIEKNSITLKSLDLNEDMMKKNLRMNQGDFLPSLNLQYTYEIENDDSFDFDGEDNWNLAAILSVPLFKSGENFAGVKKAQYEFKQTKQQIAYSKQNYLIAAENVFNKLVTKAEVIENNRTALKLAEENHKAIIELYEQGMVTNSEQLDAEVMLFSSRMNLIAAYYDFIITKYEMKKYTNDREE